MTITQLSQIHKLKTEILPQMLKVLIVRDDCSPGTARAAPSSDGRRNPVSIPEMLFVLSARFLSISYTVHYGETGKILQNIFVEMSSLFIAHIFLGFSNITF